MNYRRLFIKNGLIFITIVTNNRIPILINNVKLLKQGYKNVRKYYDFRLIAYSIQNDHIHCIIKPYCINDYPRIIKSFKYSITKLINVGLVNPTYNKIWQNRYWEHTIRDENDLWKHFDYIHYNSMKHYNVLPKDWKYSSFNKFVTNNYYEKNWCNLDDKYEISNMDLE